MGCKKERLKWPAAFIHKYRFSNINAYCTKQESGLYNTFCFFWERAADGCICIIFPSENIIRYLDKMPARDIIKVPKEMEGFIC